MASRTDPARADVEREVIRLTRDGMTQREVAAELGISHATVHRYLKSGLDRVVAPEVGELRTASYQRLTALLPVQEKAAVKGDARAAATVVKVDESIRKLYGLDAPEHIGVVLQRRDADMVALVADALSEALAGVVGALHLAPHEARFTVELEQYGGDLATWALDGRQGPRPVAPVRPAPPVQRVIRGELMPPPDKRLTDVIERALSIIDAEVIDDDDMEAAS